MYWLNELGGQFNKVTMQEIVPGNNTMLATEDIAYGEVIAHIPYAMHVT